MACKDEKCADFFTRLKEVAGPYWLSHSLLGEHTSVMTRAGRQSLEE